MRVRRQRRPPGTGHDRWVIPYADFVTLLFACFTALYAVAAVDATRLPAVAEGVREAVGLPPVAAPVTDPLREVLERSLADDLSAGRIELVDDRRGVVLAVPEAFSFANGSADLSDEARGLLSRVAAVLQPLPNPLRIEGHTDNTPIHTLRFSSNFELSTARATEVVAFLITACNLPPARLSAAGYSEYRPRAGNDTVEGRARNRRVDVVVLSRASSEMEPEHP